MKRVGMNWFALLCLCVALSGCERLPDAQVLAHGRFSSIGVYHHNDNDGPPILLIADSRDDATVTRNLLAAMLARKSDVFLINTSTLRADFAGDLTQCQDFNGDFENLARYLEAWLQLPGFIPPLLATTSESNALVETLLAPVSAQVFPGRLLFTESVTSPAGDAAQYPDCSDASVTAQSIGINVVVDDEEPDGQQLDNALLELSALLPEQQALDENVADLPLAELPGDETGSSFAILISGDGGWAGFDQQLAAAMQQQGIAVVGWDSLRYFWKPRTPQSVAADIERVIMHYQQHWDKQRVILIGFSQGANVLPFTLEHLGNAAKEAVSAIALISPERFAQFEFHLSDWVHPTEEGLPLAPVLDNYRGVPLYCIYGSQDEATVCPLLHGTQVEVRGYDAGHHLYDEIPAIVELLKN